MSLPFQVINTAQDLKKNIKGPETFCFGVFTEKKNYTILFYGVSHKVSYYASFQGKKARMSISKIQNIISIKGILQVCGLLLNLKLHKYRADYGYTWRLIFFICRND